MKKNEENGKEMIEKEPKQGKKVTDVTEIENQKERLIEKRKGEIDQKQRTINKR